MSELAGLKEQRLKTLHVVAGVIACLLAIIFLLLSVLVEPSSKLGCMFFSAFGGVFLSIGMVAFMYEYLIKREFLGTTKEILSRVIEEELVKVLSVAKALEEMGISDIQASADDYDHMKYRIRQSKKFQSITIGAQVFFYQMQATLIERIRRAKQRGENFELQVLLMNPDSKILEYVPEETAHLKRAIEKSTKFLSNIYKQTGKHDGIEVKYYDFIPYCAMGIYDDELIRYIPYLGIVPGVELSVFEIKKHEGGIFDSYARYFEHIWERAKSVDLDT